jgi:hypothetical protein
MIYVNPRKIVMVLRVAIKGAILPFEIRTPFSKPTSIPTQSVNGIARAALIPVSISFAEIIDVNAMIAPTERSIPPEIMTNN